MPRRLRATLAALASVVTVVAAGAVPAGADDPIDVPPAGERVVVRVDGGAHDAAQAAAAVGGEVASTVAPGTYVVEAPGAAGGAVERLEQRSDVVWAEADVTFRAADRVPNDACWTDCFGVSQDELVRVGAPAAWDVTTGDPSVRVAVLDTGVDTTHPDLLGKVDVGPTFVSSPSTCSPQQRDLEIGHGTAVASLIAAVTDNLNGMAGMGWDTRVLSIRVLDDCGFGRSSDIAAGMRAAADAGAPVLNLSFSAGNLPQVVADAIAYARSRGALIVAAVGNEGSSAVQFPADFPGVIGVAGTDPFDHLLGFSNRGPWADVAAPGNQVLVATPGTGYSLGDGTSFSAPIVSATAALLFAAEPGLGAPGVARRLARTAERGDLAPTDVTCGRLDAGAALTATSMQRGYAFVARDGGTFTFGDAGFSGSSVGLTRLPMAAMAWAPTSCGYWEVSAGGEVFAHGGADHVGDLSGVGLNRPIVGMAPTASGDGYWLVASDGGIFTFGDAGYFGSMGGIPLNRPIVGMAPTPTGQGYWLVASDGGIFSFGDAAFFGSTGSIVLNRPVVGMAPTPSGRGYWFVASDGGIFSFGDAAFFGSTGSIVLNRPVVGMAPTPSGRGYWFVASDGGIFAFGDAPFLGSTGSIPLAQPIVGMSAF